MNIKQISLLAICALSANAWISGQNYKVVACWVDDDCDSASGCCAVIKGSGDTDFARVCSYANLINNENGLYT